VMWPENVASWSPWSLHWFITYPMSSSLSSP
jgi:hypothetical protein